ncbi:MAG: translation elongation factor Ts [Nitrospirae bacterium]|nr:translation elongation factor Ts [Nitrospirota bacterium]
MTEISAAVVKDLREKTGAGMMECKKALTDAGGDAEKAIDILRQKGLASAAKKASRSASQGLISSLIQADKVGVMAEINCETDFVARTDDFQELIKNVMEQIAAAKPTAVSIEESPSEKPENCLLEQIFVNDPGKTKKIRDLVTEKVAKLGENIVIRRFMRYQADNGLVNAYIHMDKIGVMVAADSAANADELRPLIKDVAMHIAAANPSYISRDQIPQDVIDREKAIYRAQVTGKPAEITEKIVEGKLEKYYGDVCLVDQIFVKDPEGKKKIRDVIGTGTVIKSFARFQLGELQPAEPKSC